MKKLKLLVIVVSAILLASCSLLDISHTSDDQTDFSQYRSFSWYKEGFSDSIRGVFNIDTANLDSAIRSTIQQQFQLKGLTFSDPDTADLWINYQAITQTTLSDRYVYSLEDINQSYIHKQIRYSSSFDASRRYSTAYEQGTFIVDVIDRSEMLLVWRGTVETPIGLYEKESNRIERIQKALEKLLTQYPAP